ncbi:MAG: peptide MFS transporter [Pseudomonadota bacterium]
MLKGHPKGLYVAFFANMGERFGFYTMMAILVLFLQARYGLAADKAGYIYSIFYFLIYALALLGGFIADRTQRYKGTIMTGIIIMFLGYVIMAIPGMGLPVAVMGLFTIAFGNGLFKGNLQALVGQMYDAPKYSKLRDSAFSVFYMGINIGAVFAPNAAKTVRNWYLGTKNMGYDPDLPSLCWQLKEGTLEDTAKFQVLADKVSGAPVTDLGAFADSYVNIFSTGYNYAFAIAAGAMLVSLLTYVLFKRLLPDRKSAAEAQGDAAAAIKMPWAEEKKRLTALGLVFLVVIFFWMSFHQNGLTLTYFARDYTAKAVGPLSYLIFDIKGLLMVAAMIIGIVLLVRKASTAVHRGIGLVLAGGGAAMSWYLYGTYANSNPIEAEIFQQFNPYFVVFLTPVVVGLFTWLRNKGKEPSTPRKIGIGMILAAVGFAVMIFGSFGLVSPADLAGTPSPDRISPYWLMSTYFTLTVAELFLSPMGISFVSKVSPPRFQGLMQGGWLGATALGNQLLFIGSSMWVRFDIWMVWCVFVVCCLVSATFIFSILKKLEAATSDA